MYKSRKVVNFMKKMYDWNYNEFFKAILGVIMYSIGINLFIRPIGLFNGGILGLSQLLNSLCIKLFSLGSTFNISGILNLLFNIPLLVLAYTKVNDTFLRRTLLCVAVQTIALSFIPIPKEPIITDFLTSTLIGSLLAGIGSGMIFSTGGSCGGTDIIGVIASLNSKNAGVGKISLYINSVIYIISGIFFGVNTMIYSMLYSIFASFIVDKNHEKNICTTAMIFTKNDPEEIIKYIKETLKRDATFWKGKGGYKNSTTYITYVALSKYELSILEKDISKYDSSAFIIINEGVNIDGNFQRKI